tara:strand:+ start:335 stop:508 length:174 start_codon:yes stop_codon:yes gene_type:complete
MKKQIFHIYKREDNEVVKACVTVDELEHMMAHKEIDWEHWDIESCYIDDSETVDASF